METSALHLPEVIILEQTPRWESELRRRFPFAGARLSVCRDTQEVLTQLRTAAGSLCLLTLDVEKNPQHSQEVLHLIARIRNDSPQAELIVIWSGAEDCLEWALREQGVQYFLKDTQATADRIARLCRDRLEESPCDLQSLLPESARW